MFHVPVTHLQRLHGSVHDLGGDADFSCLLQPALSGDSTIGEQGSFLPSYACGPPTAAGQKTNICGAKLLAPRDCGGVLRIRQNGALTTQRSLPSMSCSGLSNVRDGSDMVRGVGAPRSPLPCQSCPRSAPEARRRLAAMNKCAPAGIGSWPCAESSAAAGWACIWGRPLVLGGASSLPKTWTVNACRSGCRSTPSVFVAIPCGAGNAGRPSSVDQWLAQRPPGKCPQVCGVGRDANPESRGLILFAWGRRRVVLMAIPGGSSAFALAASERFP